MYSHTNGRSKCLVVRLLCLCSLIVGLSKCMFFSLHLFLSPSPFPPLWISNPCTHPPSSPHLVFTIFLWLVSFISLCAWFFIIGFFTCNNIFLLLFSFLFFFFFAIFWLLCDYWLICSLNFWEFPIMGQVSGGVGYWKHIWHTKWTMNTTICSRSYSLETLVLENPISSPGLPETSFVWSLNLPLVLNSQPEHYRLVSLFFFIFLNFVKYQPRLCYNQSERDGGRSSKT